ncbi:MAG: hypothetical protein K5898_11780 [Ruminococcus sp.]|uniref:hypothetical protein n=1 Tax=Ruminococcus sp. TaxID=41978 RepID=UPI0025F3ECD0|nr:hypothetical protein [Ruminococcus sp.]MCR4795818.1 hypothetical protein [Ruminococcus sp.]
MKKTKYIVIVLVAVLSLCSCGDNSSKMSKSREKTSSTAEMQKETEKITQPDIDNNYKMVDAFDKIKTDIFGVYPTDFKLFYNTSESDYNQKNRL